MARQCTCTMYIHMNVYWSFKLWQDSERHSTCLLIGCSFVYIPAQKAWCALNPNDTCSFHSVIPIKNLCISQNHILNWFFLSLLFFICFALSIGGLHLAIEEQDPLPNHDDVNDETPQPVNSEFITINVASNEQVESAKKQIPNG